MRNLFAAIPKLHELFESTKKDEHKKHKTFKEARAVLARKREDGHIVLITV